MFLCHFLAFVPLHFIPLIPNENRFDCFFFLLHFISNRKWTWHQNEKHKTPACLYECHIVIIHTHTFKPNRQIREDIYISVMFKRVTHLSCNCNRLLRERVCARAHVCVLLDNSLWLVKILSIYACILQSVVVVWFFFLLPYENWPLNVYVVASLQQ